MGSILYAFYDDGYSLPSHPPPCPRLDGVPLLVLANKQDMAGVLTAEQVSLHSTVIV